MTEITTLPKTNTAERQKADPWLSGDAICRAAWEGFSRPVGVGLPDRYRSPPTPAKQEG